MNPDLHKPATDPAGPSGQPGTAPAAQSPASPLESVSSTASRVFAAARRLVAAGPATEEDSLAQIPGLLACADCPEGRRAIAEFLSDNNLPQLRHPAVRAMALNALEQSSPGDEVVLKACALEILRYRTFQSSTQRAAEIINSHPIQTQGAADAVAGLYRMIIPSPVLPRGELNEAERVLGLLEPKFAVPPSEKMVNELCQGVLGAIKAGLPPSPQSYQILALAGTRQSLDTLTDVAIENFGGSRSPSFLDAYSAGMPGRVMRFAVTTALIYGVMNLGSSEAALESIALWNGLYTFVLSPLLFPPNRNYAQQEQPSSHPINGVRAASALGQALPSAAAEDALVTIALDAQAPYGARREAAKILARTQLSETSLNDLSSLASSAADDDHAILSSVLESKTDAASIEILKQLNAAVTAQAQAQIPRTS